MDYNITYRQKDKGWQLIISYKLNGKWKQKSKQGFKNKKDAKPVAEKMVLELKKQIKNSDNIINEKYSTLLFNELANLFIKHSKLYKENNTTNNYKYAKNKFEIIRNMQTKNIKRIHIQKVVDKLVIDGLKAGSIKTYLSQIKLFFDYYIENYDSQYINPIKKISIPKTEKKCKIALTKDELYKTLDYIKNNEDVQSYITCLIAGTCGLRLGEIQGLTWDDLNEKESTLSINKQWKINNNGIFDFGKLKSKNSKRIVPIPNFTLQELLKYKKDGITDIKNRIIIINRNTFSSKCNYRLRKVFNISIHELRHTYATLLIANGIDFKTTSKLLGHDVKETMKTYSHVTDDMLKNASNKIAKIF